jgi:hypothetical protein
MSSGKENPEVLDIQEVKLDIPEVKSHAGNRNWYSHPPKSKFRFVGKS